MSSLLEREKIKNEDLTEKIIQLEKQIEIDTQKITSLEQELK